ncbi:hypothetical protein LTR27_010898 [Elasticomyces elasticus]|nr:hypothetical protein LTR27_010898 [Elasticomyces elasticus]
MVASSANPTGFSYAQAAKGRSPATSNTNSTSAAAPTSTPPSKATSEAATPTIDSLLELKTGGNWADDVEATVGEKQPVEPEKPAEDVTSSVSPSKESSVERTKAEEKSETSGVSSPDLTMSGSATTKDDDSSTAPTNGSASDTTWETKSQASEPAWIADRKERQQASSQKSDTTVKPEKKVKESPAPAPPKPVLQEAAAPQVNIWIQRLQAQKTRAVTAQPTASKDTSSTSHTSSATAKENQRPRADPRKKAMSVDEVAKSGDVGVNPRKANKSTSDARNPGLSQSTNAATETPARTGLQTRSSMPNVPNAATFDKNTGVWPTPEVAQDHERKDSTEKDGSKQSDATPSAKTRKQAWATIPVTPTIKWESQNARGADGQRPPGSERSGRGGSVRGRGAFRGGATSGPNGTARPAPRGSVSLGEEEAADTWKQRGRSDTLDRQAMPPPPAKATRASSESSRREQTKEASRDRSVKTQKSAEVQSESDAKPKAQPTEASTATWVDTQSSATRTASPKGIDSAAPNGTDEARVPEPIPRRSSVGTQTEAAARDGPLVRMVPSESRKEHKSFDGGKEPYMNGSVRGNKRGGRGRGGAGQFTANGHLTGQHAYSNGDVAGSPAYVPQSPSAYQASRGNHLPYPTRGGRGGQWRADHRTQSIPESYYGRYNNPYGPAQTVPGQAFVPGMYDFNGYPMSAVPYNPFVEHQYLMGMVNLQIEYYFSIDNLLKDMFLRKKMDSQGFVFLDLVASFNRIKQLTQDRNVLRDVCLASETIEIRVGEDGKERLRRRDGYEQFVLPKEERNESAQTDGPKHLHRPERPQAPSFGQLPARGMPNGAPPGMQQQQRFDRRSEGGYPMMNGNAPHFGGFPAMPEQSFGEMTNGDDSRGRAAKSPTQDDHVSPTKSALDTEKDGEPDAFPNDQVGILTVMVRVKKGPPFHNEATRTFSNGSIDSRSIFAELEKSSGSHAVPTTNGDGAVNGDGPSQHNEADKSRSAGGPAISDIYWVKEQVPQPETLPNDVSFELYTRLRSKALEQRSHAATGTCPYDLDVLYKFWSHFLLRNFNARMYGEFHHYANEDRKARHSINGLSALVKFYNQALHSPNPIRECVVRDYVELVNYEPTQLEGTAFKQLRSAWRDGALNLKNRKKLIDVVSPALKARLDEDITSP